LNIWSQEIREIYQWETLDPLTYFTN
jgi:hypothetical protein